MRTIQNEKNEYIIGLISDTHGQLSSNALNSLRGCDLIIHAGDIDTPEVLDRLKEIAPTVAVRGNMDQGAWARSLPVSRSVRVGEALLFIRHILAGPTLREKEVHAIIYGHTHQPEAKVEDGRFFVNPGSASAPRNQYAPSVAKLHLHGKNIQVEHIMLDK